MEAIIIHLQIEDPVQHPILLLDHKGPSKIDLSRPKELIHQWQNQKHYSLKAHLEEGQIILKDPKIQPRLIECTLQMEE